MKNIYRSAFVALTLLFATGCEKLELDLAPENNFTDLTYWSSENKAQSVLNTAYS